MLGADASVILAQRDQLLAEGIPALSQATGRFKLTQEQIENVDFQSKYVNNENLLPWPRKQDEFGDLADRWLHSDIKDLPFPYGRLLFKNLIQQGDLR